MTDLVEDQIADYLESLSEPKRGEIVELHQLILGVSPGCRLWFSDGRNEEGKVVSNPNIGYGQYTIRYTDGSEKEFFRIGLSGNSSGISVYVMGLEDKSLLRNTIGDTIGKATVTGYCIKFRKLADIDIDVLMSAVCVRLEQSV